MLENAIPSNRTPRNHAPLPAIRSRPRTLSAFLLLATLAAGPALGYRIFLKDGTQVSSQGPYSIDGEFALVTLESGTETRLRLDEIDAERTATYNQTSGVDRGVVIEPRRSAAAGTPGAAGVAASRDQTLQDLIRARAARDPGGPVTNPRPSLRVRQTAAGYDDLLTMTRLPFEPQALADRVQQALREQGMSRFALHQGTREGRVLVEAIADSEGAVFRSLEQACLAYLALNATGRAPAIELLLQTAGRERAGQFLLTAENAPLLANGTMTAADFFVEHVRF